MRKFSFIFLLLFLFHPSLMLYSQESIPITKTDVLLIILVAGLSIISIVITIIIVFLVKIIREKKKEIIVLKELEKEERRKHLRDFKPAVIRVKQPLPDGGHKILKFKNRNISRGGVFIITENLSLFDLGEELEIIIKDGGKNYYEGKAIVIHSEAIFNKNSVKTESGFGIMFLSSM